MFVFALCLLGTALALPAVPPAPILPIGSDLYVSGPEGIVPYGMMAPMFTPFRTLEYKIEEEPKEELREEEPKEFNEEREEIEFEKKEEEPRVEEETKIEEEPKTEEEPKKPVTLKPETVVIKLDIPKPPAFIGNWLSSWPFFSLPSSISSWFSRGERIMPTRYIYPDGYRGGYVIVEKPRV